MYLFFKGRARLLSPFILFIIETPSNSFFTWCKTIKYRYDNLKWKKWKLRTHTESTNDRTCLRQQNNGAGMNERTCLGKRRHDVMFRVLQVRTAHGAFLTHLLTTLVECIVASVNEAISLVSYPSSSRLYTHFDRADRHHQTTGSD